MTDRERDREREGDSGEEDWGKGIPFRLIFHLNIFKINLIINNI